MLEEPLVVCDLEVKFGAELVLQVLGEDPGDQVTYVDRPRRAPPCVEYEFLSGFIPLQNPIQIPV